MLSNMREKVLQVFYPVPLNPVNILFRVKVKNREDGSFQMLSLYGGWLIFYDCFLEHITKSFLCIEEFALVRYVPNQGVEIS